MHTAHWQLTIKPSAVYEMLQKWLPYGPAKHHVPKRGLAVGAEVFDLYPDHIGGYRNTQRTFSNLEQKLGMDSFL